jgi:hypothetical protein
MGAARRWLTAGDGTVMITGSDGHLWAHSQPSEGEPPMTRWNWMISPDTHPRSAPEAEKVTVNRNPGAWGLFVFPSIELPPPGTAFTDTSDVLLTAGLLDVLGLHGQDGTWWVAKVPPEDGSTGEPRYLTITYGSGQYELRHTPSSARHPFILASPARDDAAL